MPAIWLRMIQDEGFHLLQCCGVIDFVCIDYETKSNFIFEHVKPGIPLIGFVCP
jgi:hypothetical protein